MCGFCGFTGNSHNDENNSVLGKMTERIAHRGPDGAGYYVDDDISLGFRRLSFFDLEGGNQPMHSDDKTLTIVFNGEIYNFQELKTELEAKGRVFKTTSDTEVLLHLYEEHGADMPNLLRGMFSFVIYNHKNNEVFAARDYFGIKPFYYGIFNGELLFASEIKAFLDYPGFVKALNHEALEFYLSFQYSVLDSTFFKGVYKLPPAHIMKFKDGKMEIFRYWQAAFNPSEAPLDDIVEKIDGIVKNSVEYHQKADVPIGSLLSGGVDSSYVAAVSSVEKTFTVGFDYEGFSEINSAKKLTAEKGAENISKIITTAEFWDVLPRVQYLMDEPLADAAAVALYFVCKLAREHVKGVLSGEGADELFGGYGLYREPLDLAPITALPAPLRKILKGTAERIPLKFKGKNYMIRGGKRVEERYIGNAHVFTEDERKKILLKPSGSSNSAVTKPHYDKIGGYDDVTKMQFLDIHLWMVGDILLKADKMSMANSLEARVPFLDKEVFKIASSIPTRYRMNKKAGKYALRLAARRNFADKQDKKRLGFPVPTRLWLREDKYFNIVLAAFKKDFMAEFFVVKELLKLLYDHKECRADNGRKIWTIYTFSLWYEAFFVEQQL